MNFMEAMKAAREGKHVKRAEEDVFSEDWEVVDESR